MHKKIYIVDQEYIPLFTSHGIDAKHPLEYIQDNKLGAEPSHIYNLSSDLAYQQIGYYASLIALSRHHKVQPNPQTIRDFLDRKLRKIFSEEIHEMIQKTMKNFSKNEFELSIYLGKSLNQKYNKLAWELYRLIPAPMFRVYFKLNDTWKIDKLKLLTMKMINDEHREFLLHRTLEIQTKQGTLTKPRKHYKYDLAILVNDEEKAPPSGKKALKAFETAFKKAGFRTYFIQKKENPNISEYDALFIRETTSVNHHTYRFARQAQIEGLVVIDDPDSIVKCTNKIYLEQLMDHLKISRPKSYILHKTNYSQVLESVTFPCILKKPDSAFSQGVYKADNKEEFKKLYQKISQSSELILVQEFIATDFDWRIGILNQKILYVCKYYMASGHWQIINNHQDQTMEEGNFESLDPKDVDPKILNLALDLTKQIGSGFYGVDLKQSGEKLYVIEVNDNPSIDHGVEDKYLKHDLYDQIAQYFLEQCHKKRGIHA